MSVSLTRGLTTSRRHHRHDRAVQQPRRSCPSSCRMGRCSVRESCTRDHCRPPERSARSFTVLPTIIQSGSVFTVTGAVDGFVAGDVEYFARHFAAVLGFDVEADRFSSCGSAGHRTLGLAAMFNDRRGCVPWTVTENVHSPTLPAASGRRAGDNRCAERERCARFPVTGGPSRSNRSCPLRTPQTRVQRRSGRCNRGFVSAGQTTTGGVVS